MTSHKGYSFGVFSLVLLKNTPAIITVVLEEEENIQHCIFA